MWIQFIAGFAIGTVFLFLPGALLARALRFPWVGAIAVGPTLSLAGYCALAVIYGKVGVAMSWTWLFAPALVTSGALFLASAASQRRRMAAGDGPGMRAWRMARPASPRALMRWCLGSDAAMLGLYLLLGLVFTGLVFALSLPSAASFTTGIDNITHLGAIQAFLDSGVWSSLGTTVYTGADFTPPSGSAEGGFYPFGWHTIAAMTASALALDVPVAINATCAVFLAFVYPASSFLLMKTLFPHDRTAILFGAIACLGFAAFPWRLLSAGPMTSNMAALCLMPAACALFVELLRPGTGRPRRWRLAAALAVSLVGIAFAQPNVAFTMMVFLAPYCIYRIVTWRRLDGAQHPRLAKGIACAAFAALFAAVWAIAFNAPFMQGIVQYTWGAYQGVGEALWNFALGNYRDMPAQPVLTLLIIGGIWAALCQARTRWLVVGYLVMGCLYVLSTTTDGFAKQLLTGFWYTDPIRLGANAAVLAVPLVALALATLSRKLATWVKGKRPSLTGRTRRHTAVGAVWAAFLVVCLFPNFAYIGKAEAPSPLFWVGKGIEIDYGPEGSDYDPIEVEFVEQAREAIGEDALVINEPVDGSAFAYGASDLNAYYRSFVGYDGTETSELIRTRLSSIADDAQVRDAVHELGAEYVLLLDQPGHGDELETLSPFSSRSTWAGIDSITDETPGFEVVLAKDDMRLYRITG